MQTVTLYHNPRCSKSREALALLRERGVEPLIVEYLKTPPDAATLRGLLAMLHMDAKALLRTGEAVYKVEYRDRELDADGWIAAMVAHPVLIERPIAVMGDHAVVGRPPERVLDLLDGAL